MGFLSGKEVNDQCLASVHGHNYGRLNSDTVMIFKIGEVVAKIQHCIIRVNL